MMDKAPKQTSRQPIKVNVKLESFQATQLGEMVNVSVQTLPIKMVPLLSMRETTVWSVIHRVQVAIKMELMDQGAVEHNQIPPVLAEVRVVTMADQVLKCAKMRIKIA
jgi:hypothetical protein